jgi:hypothetical protein
MRCMTPARRVLLLVWLVAAAPSLHGQQPAPAPAPAVILTPAEMEQFLLKGEIVRKRASGKGVTNTVRATLSDGRMTHDAQFQTVDERRTVFEAGAKSEINFKDTYRFNIGGYRLARMLGLNVPMSVKRRYENKDSAVTWWLDDVFDEGERGKLKDKSMGPDPVRTSKQLSILAVFDELIENVDRNTGNLQWTKSDWTMWMIDHTRAFRLGKNIRRPEKLTRCDRSLLEGMRKLTLDGLTQEMGDVMQKDELEAVIARRDKLVKHFDDRIAARGEASVLFTF